MSPFIFLQFIVNTKREFNHFFAYTTLLYTNASIFQIIFLKMDKILQKLRISKELEAFSPAEIRCRPRGIAFAFYKYFLISTPWIVIHSTQKQYHFPSMDNHGQSHYAILEYILIHLHCL